MLTKKYKYIFVFIVSNILHKYTKKSFTFIRGFLCTSISHASFICNLYDIISFKNNVCKIYENERMFKQQKIIMFASIT